MASTGSGSLIAAKWVKLMCSFGGRFTLRPGDGTLRYAGGQTRLISVPRAASFGDLLRKVGAADAELLVVKYQLPGEDLDSLVSVSGPEEYENMMEEYDKLAAAAPDGSAKLRMFLFRGSGTASACSSSHHLAAGADESGQKRYIDAINCVSVQTMRRKGSPGSSAHSSELASEFCSLPPPSLPSECSYSGGAHYPASFPEPASLRAVPVTSPATGVPAVNPIFVRTEPQALQPLHQAAAAAAAYATPLQYQEITTFVLPLPQTQLSSYLQQMPVSYSYMQPQQFQYVNAQQFTFNFVPVEMSRFVPSISVATVRPVLENMHFARFILCP